MQLIQFCPNPDCTLHQEAPESDWYSLCGHYTTRAFGHVPRFRCRICGKWFSRQTFSIDYYAKKKVNYRDLLQRHVSSESGRSLARGMGLSCDSVQNRLDRLARQALALHERLRPLARNNERVCVDGFVSFDVSQYFPNELTMSITADSRFILDLAHASRRRSGTMTPTQKNRTKLLYPKVRFERSAIARTFRDVLDSLARERPPVPGRPLILTTDEKPEYAHVLDSHPVFRNQTEVTRVIHQTVNSHAPRTFDNPLFASNYLDRELRKDQANHHRESTCFSRNVANTMSRLACYLVQHNYRKKYLIKASARDCRVHAQVAGIPGRMIEAAVESMFTEREFLSRLSLPPTLDRIWRKTIPTPLKTGSDYLPAFALG